MYVDILLAINASAGLLETKKYLKHHFVIKDMESLNTFWGLKLHIKNIVRFFLNESIF